MMHWPRANSSCGVILAANDDLADSICKLLPAGTTRLGGARTAGYGKVRIDKIRPNQTWTETPQTLRDRQPGDTFVVTLLSDAILRDERGVPCADIAAALPGRRRNRASLSASDSSGRL